MKRHGSLSSSPSSSSPSPSPDGPSPDGPSPSAPSPSPGPPGNIELVINEKGFDGSLKRVDISVFVPNDSKVVVKDYAKNTARESLTGIENYGLNGNPVV